MTMYATAATAIATNDAADDLHRNAYNAAFYELGLGWHWDAGTFDGLKPLACEVERIKTYMEAHQSHLLRAYEPQFLSSAIETTKSRCFDLMRECGTAVAGQTDWAALQSRQIGA